MNSLLAFKRTSPYPSMSTQQTLILNKNKRCPEFSKDLTLWLEAELEQQIF
jgi:hypothetical protein